MPNFLEKFKNIGVPESLEFSLKRKVQISNLLFPVTGLCTLLILFSVAALGMKSESILNTGLFAFLLIVSTVFNWIRWYTFARNLFLAIMVLGVCSSAFFAGEALEIEIIFIPSIGIPFVLFTRSEIRNSLIWCVVFGAAYFFMGYLYNVIIPLDPLSPEEAVILNNVIVVILFIWMISVFMVLRNENQEREDIIQIGLKEEKNLRGNLEENYKQLINSQEALIEKERERIQAQENEASALKKADFKTRFLAKMSHELRTPLNGIIGNVELWKRKGELEGEDKQYLNRISNSSQMLLGIVNDVLDLSKIEEGKMELHPVTISFEKLIGNSMSLYESMASDKGIELQSNLDIEVPQFMKVDALRLSQIVNNLVSNAIKFSEKGVIKIKAEKFSNELLKVKVCDSGKGLSESDQEMLFKDYAQVGNSLEGGGTGLGLSICKSLAKLMGGQIGVDSILNEGSDFWFTFKYNSVTNEEIAEDFIQVSDVKLNLNVLIVDDMEINLSLAKAMLEEYSCVVTTANSGADAISKYEVGKFDLVLMDINMPDKNGDVVVQELKEKLDCDSVFIGLSANAMEGEKERYLKKGLDDYISKPITFDKLLTCLQSWFNTGDSKMRTIQTNSNSSGFLVDQDKVEDNMKLMGGKSIYNKFIDKFIQQNDEIIKEIKLSYAECRREDYSLALHKLSGIASSMGATGYYEVLHEAHSVSKLNKDVSEEEMQVIYASAIEVNECFTEIRKEWE